MRSWQIFDFICKITSEIFQNKFKIENLKIVIL